MAYVRKMEGVDGVVVRGHVEDECGAEGFKAGRTNRYPPFLVL